MTDAIYDLPNGLTIDAENPERHDTPFYCRRCEVFYYFNHICPDNVDFPVQPHTAMKRGMKGMYDGEL